LLIIFKRDGMHEDEEPGRRNGEDMIALLPAAIRGVIKKAGPGFPEGASVGAEPLTPPRALSGAASDSGSWAT
jgi:hypothetical protein